MIRDTITLVQTGVDSVDRKDVSELFLFISSGVDTALVHSETRVLCASSTSGFLRVDGRRNTTGRQKLKKTDHGSPVRDNLLCSEKHNKLTKPFKESQKRIFRVQNYNEKGFFKIEYKLETPNTQSYLGHEMNNFSVYYQCH